MYDFFSCRKFNTFIGCFIVAIVSFFLWKPQVNAVTSAYNGNINFKMVTGNWNDGIQDGVAVSPEFLSGTFPNGNYTYIPGSSDLNYNGYWFVKYFNFYFDTTEPFEVGKTYAIDVGFAYGSYITFTDFYGWRLVADRHINYCGGDTANDLAQCSMVWNPQNDTENSRMVILFRPNKTKSYLGISIGDRTAPQHFVFWNRYGNQQGFKINDVSITSTQNSGSADYDFSQVLEELENNRIAINNNTQAIEDNTQAIEDMHDDIMSDDSSDAEDMVSDFFDDFNQNSHGLSGVITAPIQLLNNLTSATCSPLEFDLPFVRNHVVLPCMKPIYQNYFGVFFTLWQTITTGVITYTICLNIYKKVRDLQNPNNDRIEVLNL